MKKRVKNVPTKKKSRSRIYKTTKKNKKSLIRNARSIGKKSNPRGSRRNGKKSSSTTKLLHSGKYKSSNSRAKRSSKNKIKNSSNNSSRVRNKGRNSNSTRTYTRHTSRKFHKPSKITQHAKSSGRTRYSVKAFYQKESPKFFLANKKYLKFRKSVIVKTKNDILDVLNEVEFLRDKILRFFKRYKSGREQFFSIGYDIALFIDKENGQGYTKVFRQISYMPVTKSFGKADLNRLIDLLLQDMEERIERYLARHFSHFLKVYGIDLEVQTSEVKNERSKRN